MLSSLVGFLLVITIIVFIHELGHYVAARLIGVRILEFSIGFGKTLFQWKDSHDTLWKICILPLGGYVKMLGDKDIASSEDDTRLSLMPQHLKNETFAFQSPYKRAFIAFAGPAANYLLAIIIISTFYIYNGTYIISNEVNTVVENSPAEKSGIIKDDKIISIDGESVNSFDDIFHIVSLKANNSIKIGLIRNEKKINIDLVVGEREIKDKNNKILGKVGSIGITSKPPTHLDLSIIEAYNNAIKDVWTISKMTFTVIGQMLSGIRQMDELRGTITIAEQSGSSLQSGFMHFMLYIASLSINIGFVNLLPIPILDGGHIVYCAYEAIFRRKPTGMVYSFLDKVGLLLIIFMFVISTSNDIKALLF